MVSFRSLFLALFIVLSLFSIGEVRASRKLLAPTIPDLGNLPDLPNLEYPPFPSGNFQWPEYRLPSFLRPNNPSIPSGSYFFTPPATTTTTSPKP
ncbi:hypothetical protein VNO78_11563 [Psophocarpus tetragonolobus]|uniref:Uncharacterized protein n=1 Tax=Psophocarpus tetragonolobus TaxID=3891 RepID=A0AAN9XP28_PSOTE